MKAKKILALSMAFAMLSPSLVMADVYIAGDSTACNYEYDEKYAIPRGGWGMYLENYLTDTKVENKAKSGRSSKSLTTEEEYKYIFDNIKEGDYLLIQFGHNDAKNTKPEDIELRYTDPEGDKDTKGSFKNSLYENYIKPAMEKGAKPILLTPISRLKFDENGKVKDSHGKYDDCIRELAAELNIPCLDMTEATTKLYSEKGATDSKQYHAVFYDTAKGVDGTHLNHFGGDKLASMVAKEALEIDSEGFGALVNKAELEKAPEAVTRGEFTADVSRLLALEETAETFADVDKDSPYYKGISTATAVGIVKGDNKGNFNPDAPITMQDMCVIAYRALDLQGAMTGDVNEGSDLAKNASAYAVESINALASNGIIDGSLAPKDTVTKEQSYNLLVKTYEAIQTAQKIKAEAMTLEELEKVE